MAQGKTITELPLILSADSSSSTIIVKDGVTSQIQYSALTVSPEVFQTTVDSKLALTGGTVDGQVQIVSSTSSEIPGQSSQLLPTTGWTSNGWTGNFVTGFTHTTGNTTTLVSSYSATPATTYVLGYDIVPTNTTYDVYFGQNGEYLNTSLNVTNTVGCSSKREVNPGFICYDGFQVKYFIVNDGKSGTECINGNCPKGFKCEGGECVVDLDSGVWSEKYVSFDCQKVVANPCNWSITITRYCNTCCNARPIYEYCSGQNTIVGYWNDCLLGGKSATYTGPNGIIYTQLLEDFIDNITLNDTFRGSINYGSSCDGNADCPPGYVCLGGYCVRQIITSTMISGLECSSNGYCPQGFVCNNGNCEPDLSSGLWIEIGQKPGGYPIYQGPGGVELHTGWNEGEDYSLYDNPNSYEGEYRQTCSINNDCPKGFICVDGYCVKLIQTSDLYNGMSTKGVCGCPTGYKINPVYPYTATTSCFADLESGYWTNVGSSVNSANGNITISFGGISATTNTSGTLGVYAKDYSPLRVSPSSDFDGLLMTYLRTVTGTTTSTFSLSDGNSTNVTQLRGGTSNLTNNFIGVDAGNQNVSGERNLSLGQNSLTSNVSGNKNLAIGVDSLKSAVGVDSNIAIGDSSLLNNGYGSNNVAIGVSSMMVDKDPNCSVAIGYNTLMNNSQIDENVAIGCSAGENSNTNNTIYIGARAGFNDIGSGSTFVGYASGENNLGNLNTFFGEYSGNLNTSGDNLTFIGWNSGKENTTGDENTFVGSSSGMYNQDGSGNIAVGYMAGALTLDGVTENTSPNGSIYIGNNTKSFNVDDTNSIVIGNNVESQGNNTIVIGNDENETIYLNGDLSVIGTNLTSFGVNDFGVNSTGTVSLVTDNLLIQDSQGNGYSLTTTSGQNGQVLTYTNGNATWENASGDGNVIGAGDSNYIPKWTGSTGIGNSTIFDNGSTVSIGYSNLLTSFRVSANTFNIGKGGSTSSRALFMGKSIASTWTGSSSCGQFDFNNPEGDQGVVIRTNAGYVGTGATPVAGGIISVQGGANGLILAGNSTSENHLVIDNYGKVGIGTNIPVSKLDVSVTANTIGVRISGNSDSDMLRVTQTGSGNAIVVEDSSTTDSTPFVVTSGGTVGIGIDSPLHGYKLHVRNGTATNSIGISGTMSVFESSGNTYLSVLSPDANTSGIAFGTDDIRSASYLRWSYTNNQMSLSTNRTGATLSFSTGNELPRMLITSGGTVGIGTTTPNPFTLNQSDGKLHVRGGDSGVTGGTGGSTVVIDANTTNYLSMYSPDENVSGIVFGSPSDAFGAYMRWGHSQGKLQISTANSGDYIELGADNSSFKAYVTSTGLGVDTLPTQSFTVSGDSSFIGGLTAQTISATTYLNLPSTEGISGTGTTNYIPVWTGSTGLGNSSIYNNGTFIGFYTDTQVYSEKVSIQSGEGIVVDNLMIINNNGSIALGTDFNYATWATGGGEIAIGTRGVLQDSTGQFNIGIGDKSLLQNTLGNDNIGIGAETLLSNITGIQNIAIGSQSLWGTNADRNISIGDHSGFNNLGQGNLFIGYQSGYNNGGDSNIFIGNNSYYPDTLSNNKISIANYIYGDSNNKTLGVNVTAQTNSLHVSASTNPVRFEGLQTNTASTKTVIADNNGVLYVETKPKKYVALLTQTGTSAPTAIVLENTLGTVTFGYTTTGVYSVTATGLLTTNKTSIITGGAVCSIDTLTTNGFSLLSYSVPTIANGVLNNSTLEITVYP